MSVFSEFASLRPGAPVADVQRLLAPGAAAGEDGWIRTRCASARIDLGGRIGMLSFPDDFPSNIAVAGLSIGMTLDRLMEDSRRFRPAPRRFPFAITPYVAATPDAGTITAAVGPRGYVRQIELSRPDARFPDVAFAPTPMWAFSSGFAADGDALLDDWAGGATFRESGARIRAEAHWLRHQSTPEDWHRYVANHNWDEGLAPLLWIIRQPACEPATALLAFYLCRPGEFLDLAEGADGAPGWADESVALILEIRDRFVAGAYAGVTPTIAFDAGQALREEAYLPPTPDPAALDRMIPPAMRRDIPGRAIDMRAAPATPPNPEHFRWPVSTRVPPPLTEDEQREIARVKAEAAARAPARRAGGPATRTS